MGELTEPTPTEVPEEKQSTSVWSQLGVPSEGSRSHKKFPQTFEEREVYMQHREFSEREAPLLMKNKSLFYCRGIRGRRMLPLQAASRCWQFIFFHLEANR